MYKQLYTWLYTYYHDLLVIRKPSSFYRELFKRFISQYYRLPYYSEMFEGVNIGTKFRHMKE